jgi:hypothetical protein
MQPACATAISSSGFVPLASPNRALKPWGVSFRVPLWVVRLPVPSLPLDGKRRPWLDQPDRRLTEVDFSTLLRSTLENDTCIGAQIHHGYHRRIWAEEEVAERVSSPVGNPALCEVVWTIM